VINAVPRFHVSLDRAYLVGAERVRGGQSFFKALHMQHAAFNIDLRQFQGAP
jgi:hypothetical protein